LVIEEGAVEVDEGTEAELAKADNDDDEEEEIDDPDPMWSNPF
jgi:hypothetical protein